MFGSSLVIYYRTFIEKCASITEPLQKLKEILNFIRPPVRQADKSTFLTHPDFTKPFMLDTDACEYAIGETLSQIQEGQEIAQFNIKIYLCYFLKISIH